jgi:hypothetical protein
MIVFPAIDPVFANAAAAGLGAVLLLGAIDKLREPAMFRDAVENYRLLPAAAVPALARALPLFEALAGALLLPGTTRPLGALLALALLLLVSAAIVINLLRGRDRIDCGCGGNLHTPLGIGPAAQRQPEAACAGCSAPAVAAPSSGLCCRCRICHAVRPGPVLPGQRHVEPQRPPAQAEESP